MKCKNVECENNVLGKRMYCSLTCRNVYVNKYIRNYDKLLNTNKQKRLEKENIYLQAPKICKCGEIIPYKKRDNNYCNHSCNATFTNSQRDYTLFKENIKKSIHKYLIDNNIKEEGKIGLNSLVCKNCNTDFLNKRKLSYCSDICRIEFRRKNIDAFRIYKYDTNFKFNLADYPGEFEFSLVEKHGWYSPSNKKNNLGGVSRDHMLSVKDGFELGIEARLLSHPANCKLMVHNENISKHKNSSISFIELLQRIEEFDQKYIDIRLIK